MLLHTSQCLERPHTEKAWPGCQQCLAGESLHYGNCPPLDGGHYLTLDLCIYFLFNHSVLDLCVCVCVGFFKGFVWFGLAFLVIIFIQPLLWRLLSRAVSAGGESR